MDLAHLGKDSKEQASGLRPQFSGASPACLYAKELLSDESFHFGSNIHWGRDAEDWAVGYRF